jgi:hypothetical protein
MAQLTITPEKYVRRLDAISEHNGIVYGRIRLLFEEEEKHAKAALKYKGHLALSDAFKCFFLETVELCNLEYRSTIRTPLSEFYAIFLPRLVHSFQTLCGSERVAVRGYPHHGYTLLRNLFDNVVLTSAALQKITDFYSIEGVDPNKAIDLKLAKKLRKATEFAVRKKMTGDSSGLSPQVVADLAKWDELFDRETHGGQLSMAQAMGWMRGERPLLVLPQFDESMFALFTNRFAEIGWMTHRLIPAVQPPGFPLPREWREKWRIIDQSFEHMGESLTKELGKSIGMSMVEFVRAKFPFSEMSAFPFH